MEHSPTSISNIWQIFVASNAFNFVIFATLLALLVKKFNVKGMLESVQQKIVETIESAKTLKKEAEDELKNAHKSVENLEAELKVIISEAQKSAEVIGEKILEEAKLQAKNIEANTLKVIDAESKMLISALSGKTAKASIEVAKQHVIDSLKDNKSLHEKYINESIDSLERLNF